MSDRAKLDVLNAMIREARAIGDYALVAKLLAQLQAIVEGCMRD